MRAPEMAAERNEEINRWLRLFAAAFAVSLTALVAVGIGAGLAVIHRAHDAAEAARESATATRSLLAEMAPCAPDDPPSAPACQREARTEARIDDALWRLNVAVTGAINAHDLNSQAAHEAFQRSSAPGAPAESLPPRVPVAPTPVPPRPTTPPPASSTTAPPPPPPASPPASPEPAPAAPAPPPPAPASTTTTVAPTPSPGPRAATCADVLPNGKCRPGRGRR